MERPLAIDLYCGLGGWAEGLLAEGFRVIGFDVEAHDYGSGGYPGELRIRDVRTIHGSEFKDAVLIVGSSPCQEFSYRAMPWSRAKALPPPYLGMELFHAQFRIQREASEAAGRHVPMIVENVKGAQKWVGKAVWHFGSYYLWGDVPALMPYALSARKFNPHPNKSHIKNNGGSWFPIGSPGQLVTGKNPVNLRDGVKFSASGADWFDGKPRDKMLGDKGPAAFASGSKSRREASALIAKIPFALSSHIARAYFPTR